MPPRALVKTSFICSTCRQSKLHNGRSISRRWHSVSARYNARQSSSSSSNNKDIDDFYALLLESPLPTRARTTRTGPQASAPSKPASALAPPSKSPSRPPEEEEDVASRARMVFGTRQADPEKRAARARERDAQATTVGGVRVPPRPAEPDNCCMSGCVNCVWDLYREELEEWAGKRREAEMALARSRRDKEGGAVMRSSNNDSTKGQDDPLLASQQQVTGGAMAQAALSMDDDGGGSDTNWDAEDALLPSSGSSLFAGVPVGIREFMRTEKKLGQKRKERNDAAIATAAATQESEA